MNLEFLSGITFSGDILQSLEGNSLIDIYNNQCSFTLTANFLTLSEKMTHVFIKSEVCRVLDTRLLSIEWSVYVYYSENINWLLIIFFLFYQ